MQPSLCGSAAEKPRFWPLWGLEVDLLGGFGVDCRVRGGVLMKKFGFVVVFFLFMYCMNSPREFCYWVEDSEAYGICEFAIFSSILPAIAKKKTDETDEEFQARLKRYNDTISFLSVICAGEVADTQKCESQSNLPIVPWAP